MTVNLFNLFDNKNINTQDKKSYANDSWLSDCFLNEYSDMSMALAIYYYRNISILSTVIDLICDEVETLNPILYDKEKKEYIRDHPIIDFLQNPNSDQTKTELLGGYSRYYEITANSYLIMAGNVANEPLEIYYVNPGSVQVFGNTKDMFPDRYDYQTSSGVIRFYRKENIEGKFRFITKDQTLEIWHTRDFSPYSGASALLGLTRLNSIYLEISQFLESNKHNLSLLQKGIRSSGVLTSEAALDKDDRDYLREQINGEQAGSSNVGNLMLLDGGKFDFKELSKSLKDMDFKDLKKELKKDITLRKRVPLPLVDTDGQSYNNITEAKLSLYDNAVFPSAKKYFKELSLFLIPRYKDLDIKRYELVFNPLEVQAVRNRVVSQVLELKKSNLLTINELRAILEYEGVTGGDVIYQLMSLAPLGTDPKEVSKMVQLKEALKGIKYANGDDVYNVGDDNA